MWRTPKKIKNVVPQILSTLLAFIIDLVQLQNPVITMFWKRGEKLVGEKDIRAVAAFYKTGEFPILESYEIQFHYTF